jgi:hypothetical protein
MSSFILAWKRLPNQPASRRLGCGLGGGAQGLNNGVGHGCITAPVHGMGSWVCPICLDAAPSADGGFMCLGACGHRFHTRCVQRWFGEQHRRLLLPTCPTCRTQLTELDVGIFLAADTPLPEISTPTGLSTPGRIMTTPGGLYQDVATGQCGVAMCWLLRATSCCLVLAVVMVISMGVDARGWSPDGAFYHRLHT